MTRGALPANLINRGNHHGQHTRGFSYQYIKTVSKPVKYLTYPKSYETIGTWQYAMTRGALPANLINRGNTMNDQYGTLTITMSVDTPTSTAGLTRYRRVVLAKIYIPRTMVEEYVQNFKGCNPSLCDGNLLRGTFTPEPEHFNVNTI